MTLEEFSNGFDTLVSSYRRFKDFDDREILDSIEFDEYEKSFFLTKAQEEVVLSLYNGKNPFGDSFEKTEELRRYLSNLVEEASLDPISTTSGFPLGVESSSKFFTLPPELWFITYEAVHTTSNQCGTEGILDVYPVTQDTYVKVKRNPFRGANNRRALRLDLADGVIEVVCKYVVDKYYVRYIRRPQPIILDTMPEDVTINEEQGPSECELHTAIHQRILELAVQIALRSKGIALQTESETENRRRNS